MMLLKEVVDFGCMRFYNQYLNYSPDRMILASGNGDFRCATLKRSFTENDFTLVGGSLALLVNLFLRTHLLKLFKAFILPPPNLSYNKLYAIYNIQPFFDFLFTITKKSSL